jgi:hypothetical protein
VPRPFRGQDRYIHATDNAGRTPALDQLPTATPSASLTVILFAPNRQSLAISALRKRALLRSESIRVAADLDMLLRDALFEDNSLR